MKSCKSIREIVESNIIDEEKWSLVDVQDKLLKNLLEKRIIVNRQVFIKETIKAFENNKVVILNEEWHRGIGKTSIVKEISEYYNIPVIVESYSHKRIYQSMGIKDVFTAKEFLDFDKFKSRNVIADLITNSDKTMKELRFRGFEPIGFVQRMRPLYEVG